MHTAGSDFGGTQFATAQEPLAFGIDENRPAAMNRNNGGLQLNQTDKLHRQV